MTGTRRSECLLDERPDRRWGGANVLEPEGDLVVDDRHHNLIFGILEDRGDRAGEIGWPYPSCVVSGKLDPPGEAPAVEVRDEAGESAKKRRFARAGRAEQGDPLALPNLERDVGERRDLRARVGVREALDAG